MPNQGFKTLSTLSADGTRLRLARWNDQGSKDLLVIHGLAEHIGRYAHVAQYFAEQGWRVTVLELRGHGLSEGARGHTMLWQHYADDLQAALGVIARPCSILAHSMGGLITLWSMRLSLHPEVKSVVLSNPLLGLYKQPALSKVVVGRVVSRALPWVRVSNEVDPRKLSRDQDVVEAYKADPMVYNKVTTRWAQEMLQAQETVFAAAQNNHRPLLLLIGGQDQICSPASAEEYFVSYSGPKQLQRFPDCYHELFNEPEKAEVFECIHQWLVEQHTAQEDKTVEQP